jgi:mRNA deadenylase 3'-5' endonuclease subunit Ccr4
VRSSWTSAELQLAIGGPTASTSYQMQQQSHSFINRMPSTAGGTLVRCPLRVESAYSATASQEPLFTTCHDKFIGTVDYIWYTPSAQQQQHSGSELGTGPATAAAGRFALRPLSVLQPPSLQTLHTGMPCGAWPSDHVSLVADFALYDTQDDTAAGVRAAL